MASTMGRYATAIFTQNDSVMQNRILSIRKTVSRFIKYKSQLHSIKYQGPLLWIGNVRQRSWSRTTKKRIRSLNRFWLNVRYNLVDSWVCSSRWWLSTYNSLSYLSILSNAKWKCCLLMSLKVADLSLSAVRVLLILDTCRISLQICK